MAETHMASSHGPTPNELRVLMFARDRDAALGRSVLQRAGIDCRLCRSGEEVLSEIPRGAGAVIVAEEVLSPALISALTAVIAEQPPWSDLPLLVLTVAGEVSRSSGRRYMLREPLGNVLLLERPVRPETLVSTVEITLRGRRRQYQIRDH
ncbi:MAG: hybrid sensor histidine kinase/response regulator, partial [Acidobacteria bacterium]|nr:hybrid sensor histidine kinase/response regulator [Acidobacteriota bacterium]